MQNAKNVVNAKMLFRDFFVVKKGGVNMGGKRKDLIFIPIMRYYEVKNPPSLFPVNWEELYGEDRVRYEEEPEFDKDGNYLGTKNNVYVTMSEVVNWRIMKRKNSSKDDVNYRKVKDGNLFEFESTNITDEEEIKKV